MSAGTGAVLRLLQHLLHSRLGQTALGRALQLLAAGGTHQSADDQKDDCLLYTSPCDVQAAPKGKLARLLGREGFTSENPEFDHGNMTHPV